MPNIKSAKKRVLVSKVKTMRNKSAKSSLRTVIKRANAALETGETAKEQSVKIAIKKLDQSVAKNLIHKNTAARRKSALMKKLNKAV